MDTIRTLFPKIRETGQGGSPPSPTSYTPVVIKASKIILLTKFTIIKLKTNVFSGSSILL